MSKPKAKSATPRVFIPLTKIDEAQQLIYGTITAQELDQSGETMNYEASKPNFEKWSNDIHTASGGLSKGNVRVMHGLAVAGKLTDLAFEDNGQTIEVCAKIVDPGEWEKCLEGCYTGFSVGGRYGKRWTGDDGVKYFEAIPNEVSIVDNPCVKSATFSLLKADGTEEQLSFTSVLEEPAAEPTPEEKPATIAEPGNDAVVAKATAIALAKADGTTWMDHIHDARNELIKAIVDPQKNKDAITDVSDVANKTAAASDNPEDGGEPVIEPVAKAFDVADQLKQVWTATDGKTFEKKADAEAHQATLAKAANTSEVDKLKERLAKATEPKADPVVIDLMDDFDRLAKAVNAVTTPFVDGAPVLQKGMYTVGTFSRLLCDVGTLSKSINCEGATETDTSSVEVASEIKSAMSSLGDSFKKYVADQVEELLAGLDDETYVSYYDYYYAAVTNDGEDGLAKDVCSLLDSHKDSSRAERDNLAKAYGLVDAEPVVSDELSPPMKKRFETLETENGELKKIAGEAIEKVEALSKRVEELANTPQARAPSQANIALMPGDGGFFGKKADTEEERMAVLQQMLTTHGPDRMAEMMIKAVHQGGGQKLLPAGA